MRSSAALLLAIVLVPQLAPAAPDAADPAYARKPVTHARVENCNLAAVSESIAAHRQTAADGPALDALRVAAGKCTRFVLALLRPSEVTQVCSSVENWSAGRTARELRRRIAEIEADSVLRSTVIGRACREAYVHELKTTRVVVRAVR